MTIKPNNPQTGDSAVHSSAWLVIHELLIVQCAPFVCLRLLMKIGTQRIIHIGKSAPIRFRIRRNQLLILYHQALYFFYLRRKRLVLAIYGVRLRLSLFRCNRELVAKYGRNWRSGVLNYECVKFLEFSEYVHKHVLTNAALSGGAKRPDESNP